MHPTTRVCLDDLLTLHQPVINCDTLFARIRLSFRKPPPLAAAPPAAAAPSAAKRRARAEKCRRLCELDVRLSIVAVDLFIWGDSNL